MKKQIGIYEGMHLLKKLIPDINHKNVIDMPFMMLMRKFMVHPIKFDDELHRIGYDEEKHGSINDYVLNKYGKEALELINN